MQPLKALTATTAIALCLSFPLLAHAQSDTTKPQTDAPATQTDSSGTTTTPAMGAAKPDSGEKKMDEAVDKADKMKDEAADKANSADTMQKPEAKTAATGQPQVVTEQEPTQFLAGDLMGSSVYNDQDESIGKVQDLVLDEDGKIESVVVAVGGFLGIGSKQVGLAWNSVQHSSSDGEAVLRVSTTAEELKGMPEFRTMEDIKSEAEAQQSNATAPAGGTDTTPGQVPATK